MKTSLIKYRVADFLKQHPPFQFLDEETLLTLAHAGKVSFHQSEEELFAKGQPRRPLVWVIQQGAVELVNGAGDGTKLFDILGEGDVVGFDGYPAPNVHLYSARTTSEVIVYAFDAAAFGEAALVSAEACRFLGVEVETPKRGASADSWLDRNGVPMEVIRRRLVTCPPEMRIRDAAERMALRNAEFIAVVRSDGSPIGTLSLRELRDRVATGSVPPGAPVEEAMNPEIPVIGSGMTLGAQALEMIRARTRFLLVTGDGGRLEGLLTESDLALYCGTNPCQLVREAWEIESAADLRRARERLNAFVASNLSAPEKMDWFVHLIAEFNLASLEQSIRIVGETKPAEAEISWLMLDSAARGELPTTMMPVLGAVYRRVTAGSHFEKQAGEVEGLLRASGLAGTGAGPRWVRTLAEWRKFFTALIEDPVSNEIYQNRGAFEFLAIPGSGELSRELRDHVMEEVRNGDPFLAVLANDVMARLPPLTFFKELVVDLDGARGTTLDLRRNALDPLADVARVFWMANGNTWLTGTIERLEWLGEAIPDLKERFVEAASAYRIVSYHRLRNANAEGNDGAILRPSMLSRYDQQLLKGAFRSITRLIEFTFDNFNSLRRL